MQIYEVIHRDADIVVVSKAPGIACHPLTGSKDATLIEAVGLEFPEVLQEFGDDREGGLCHRIDNGTSGLVVIARNQETRAKFRELFHEGKVEKSYLALVKGRIHEPFELKFPIAHHQKNARKMVAVTGAHVRFRSHPQEANTKGRVLLSNEKASLVRVWIGAGRRHQIRVHLASMGNPIFGDVLYGGVEAQYLLGHALHAATLTLPNGLALEAGCPPQWEHELKHLSLVVDS